MAATPIDLSKAVQKALKDIYEKKVNPHTEIQPDIFQGFVDTFDLAVTEGFKDSPAVSYDFKERILHSNEVFSAFKVHRMQEDMAARLLDDDGNIKSFEQFAEDVKGITSHQCRQWLRTEYDTAIKRAQLAADWQRFEDEKDVLPNLRWVPSTAAEPNAEHMAYWNTVLPVNHPFWSQHKPGDRWGCQCSLEATDDPVTKSPTSIDHADPGLDNNPGKDGRIFSESHPYFPDSCQDCPFNKGGVSGLFTNKAKDCYSCQYVPCFDKMSLKDKLDSLQNASSSEYGKILESIISSREFKPVEGHPNVFAMPSDERTSLLPIADKAVKHGNAVYIMANPKGSKSMDFVFKKNGNIKGYEKKNASGKNSIGNRLEESSSQARRVLINMETNYNPRLLINEIKRHFEYDENCIEVLIYKGGKEISIDRQFFFKKNYVQAFFSLWK